MASPAPAGPDRANLALHGATGASYPVEEEVMTGDEWIASFAEGLGVKAPDPSTVEAVLELAAVAAHASERTAAPIACYLAGHVGVDPASAVELARAV